MQLGWDEEMDDRNTVKSFDVYNFDKPGAKDIIETAQHIVDAVSYTHLDVYKRQAKNSWNSVEVYKVYERIAGERIGKEPTPLEGAQHAIYRKVQEEMGDFAPTTKITDDIRGRINEKYGVDIDNAIRKDGRRRTDAEPVSYTHLSRGSDERQPKLV